MGKWKEVVKFKESNMMNSSGQDDDFGFEHLESELLWYLQMETLNRQ